MDISIRRRAIFTGLKPYLSHTELLQAIQFWEMEFSSKPSYAVNVFISRCCKTPELKAKRSEMLRSVVNALESDESKLAPDPGSQLNISLDRHSDRRMEENTQQLDGPTLLFLLLLNNLFSQLDANSVQTVRSKASARIFEIKTKERRISIMMDWLNGVKEELDVNFYTEFLQKVVNLIYVELCDVVGPIKADNLLAHAMRASETEASRMGVPLHTLL